MRRLLILLCLIIAFGPFIAAQRSDTVTFGEGGGLLSRHVTQILQDGIFG